MFPLMATALPLGAAAQEIETSTSTAMSVNGALFIADFPFLFEVVRCGKCTIVLCPLYFRGVSFVNQLCNVKAITLPRCGNWPDFTPAKAGVQETRMERRIPAPGLKQAGTGVAGMTTRGNHGLESTALAGEEGRDDRWRRIRRALLSGSHHGKRDVQDDALSSLSPTI